MQSNPRIVVNLRVISANILVNLLVKLAKLRVRGGHRGSGSGEYTWERLVRSPTRGDESRGYCTEHQATLGVVMRLMRTLRDPIARNVAGTRSITRNIHQTYWDYTGDISNTIW